MSPLEEVHQIERLRRSDISRTARLNTPVPTINHITLSRRLALVPNLCLCLLVERYAILTIVQQIQNNLKSCLSCHSWGRFWRVRRRPTGNSQIITITIIAIRTLIMHLGNIVVS